MAYEATTTNLADFGWRERRMAAELLTASIPARTVAMRDSRRTWSTNRTTQNARATWKT
jgi:hypothetical protein